MVDLYDAYNGNAPGIGGWSLDKQDMTWVAPDEIYDVVAWSLPLLYNVEMLSSGKAISGDLEAVAPGAIPPGAEHQFTNNGDQTLTFLCCCAPGYEHEDTVLTDGDA